MIPDPFPGNSNILQNLSGTISWIKILLKSFISRLFGEFFDFYGRGCLQWDHASRYRRPDKHRPGTGTDQGPWIKKVSITLIQILNVKFS